VGRAVRPRHRNPCGIAVAPQVRVLYAWVELPIVRLAGTEQCEGEYGDEVGPAQPRSQSHALAAHEMLEGAVAVWTYFSAGADYQEDDKLHSSAQSSLHE
jgi:hypothetical protein